MAYRYKGLQKGTFRKCALNTSYPRHIPVSGSVHPYDIHGTTTAQTTCIGIIGRFRRRRILRHTHCGAMCMATVHAFFPISRTMGQLTFYMMEGKNYVRKRSSLSSKKVKSSPLFAQTRHYANLMAAASRIGSQLYQALPSRWRQGWMYRAFTGEALVMLKAGTSKEDTLVALWALYVEPVGKETSDNTPVAQKRTYSKKDIRYWQGKSIKASKQKARREQLAQYAGLMARASVVASRVYQQLPVHQRKEYLYRSITSCVMQLLKNDVEEEDAERMVIDVLPVGRRMSKKLFVPCYKFKPKKRLYISLRCSNRRSRLKRCCLTKTSV